MTRLHGLAWLAGFVLLGESCDRTLAVAPPDAGPALAGSRTRPRTPLPPVRNTRTG
jgi:hypothetical protein